MSLNLRTYYHDPTNHGRQFFLLREALNKKPEDRLSSDIDIIAQNIYNLKYFQTIIYDSTERLEFAKGCARYLKYAYYPKGTQVLRKGDRGNDFYIILKGDASVFVPKNEAEIKRDSADDTKRQAFERYSEFIAQSSNIAALVEATGDLPLPKGRRSEGRSKSFSIHSSDSDKPQTKVIKANPIANMILDKHNTILKDHVNGDLAYDEKLLLLNNKKFVLEPYFIKGIATFKKVTELRTGEFFGELALIFNQPRLASVIAADDLHLLMLNTSDYKEIFESQIQNVLEKMKFFEAKFDGILTGDRAKFCYLLEEKSYKFNDLIIKEGDVPDGIYIIKQGEVQLSKFSKQMGPETKSPTNAFIRRGSIQQRRIVAATLANGNYFGDFETIKGEKMKYTALSTTSTLVYKLKKTSYFNVVVQYLPAIVKILTEQAEITEESRRTRLEHTEKIQFLALPGFAGFEDKPSMSSLDRSSEDKDLHLKIKNMYKSNNEILPLHRKSAMFESIIKEVESPEETASAALKGGIKRVNSHKNFKTMASPRQTVLAPIENPTGTPKTDSAGPSLNAFKKLKDLPLSFSATNSPIGTPRKVQFPISGLDLDFRSLSSASNTPKSNRASKFKLPQLTTPKSSFSGLNIERTNEEEMSNLAERIRIRSSLVAKTLNVNSPQQQTPPSEFVNVISSNLELTKPIKSEHQNHLVKSPRDIFHSAIFVKSTSEPKETLKAHTFNKQALQSMHHAIVSKAPFKHMKRQSTGSPPKGLTKINIAAATNPHQRTKTLKSDRFEGVTQRIKTERGLAKMTLIPDGIQRIEHDFVADNQLLSIKSSETKLKKNSHYLFRNFSTIGLGK